MRQKGDLPGPPSHGVDDDSRYCQCARHAPGKMEALKRAAEDSERRNDIEALRAEVQSAGAREEGTWFFNPATVVGGWFADARRASSLDFGVRCFLITWSSGRP